MGGARLQTRRTSRGSSIQEVPASPSVDSSITKSQPAEKHYTSEQVLGEERHTADQVLLTAAETAKNENVVLSNGDSLWDLYGMKLSKICVRLLSEFKIKDVSDLSNLPSSPASKEAKEHDLFRVSNNPEPEILPIDYVKVKHDNETENRIPDEPFTASRSPDVIPDEQFIASDCRDVIPDEPCMASHSRDVIPDEQFIASESMDVIPDEQFTASHIRDVKPDEQFTASESRDVIPDEQVIASESRDVIPDEQFIASESRDVIPDEQFIASHSRDVKPDEQFMASDSRDVKPDELFIESESRDVIPDEQFIASRSRDVISDEQFIASDNQDVIPDEPFIASHSQDVICEIVPTQNDTVVKVREDKNENNIVHKLTRCVLNEVREDDDCDVHTTDSVITCRTGYNSILPVASEDTSISIQECPLATVEHLRNVEINSQSFVDISQSPKSHFEGDSNNHVKPEPSIVNNANEIYKYVIKNGCDTDIGEIKKLQNTSSDSGQLTAVRIKPAVPKKPLLLKKTAAINVPPIENVVEEKCLKIKPAVAKKPVVAKDKFLVQKPQTNLNSNELINSNGQNHPCTHVQPNAFADQVSRSPVIQKKVLTSNKSAESGSITKTTFTESKETKLNISKSPNACPPVTSSSNPVSCKSSAEIRLVCSKPPHHPILSLPGTPTVQRSRSHSSGRIPCFVSRTESNQEFRSPSNGSNERGQQGLMASRSMEQLDAECGRLRKRTLSREWNVLTFTIKEETTTVQNSSDALCHNVTDKASGIDHSTLALNNAALTEQSQGLNTNSSDKLIGSNSNKTLTGFISNEKPTETVKPDIKTVEDICKDIDRPAFEKHISDIIPVTTSASHDIVTTNVADPVRNVQLDSEVSICSMPDKANQTLDSNAESKSECTSTEVN